MRDDTHRLKKVMAISSAGGHWEQLMLLKSGWSEEDAFYVNTMRGLAEKSGVTDHYVVADCNRNNPMSFVVCAKQILRILSDEKPDVVISTGAAPGLLALIFAKLSGKNTIWIDSVANAERLSLSGRIALTFVDLCITQWAHLAKDSGPRYFGSVL